MINYLAQIKPPVGIAVDTSGNPVNPLADLFVRLWQAVMIAGGLLTIVYIIWGSIEWLTCEGDKTKLESARNKIVNSIIGLALLVGTVAIVFFIDNLGIFGEFKLLELKWVP